jgi:CubicO group peptidase (beta-lactamase class C family)
MDRRLAYLLFTLAGCTARPTDDPSLPWEGSWPITWTREEWEPRNFTGTLVLARTAEGWRPALSFAQTDAVLSCTHATLTEDSARFDFAWDIGGGTFHLDLFRDGDELHGSAESLDKSAGVLVTWSPVVGHRQASGLLVDAKLTTPWTVAAPAEVGLDDGAVRQILDEAISADYSGFVLVKDDHLVLAAGSAPARQAQVTSVSKALSSLAVPFLLAEGKWPSIDAPIGGAIGWPAGDPRSEITLRNVLSHTTGLEVPDYESWFSKARQDYRADLQSAALVDPPGTRFKYSNRAAELTSEVVAQAAGEPLDTYLVPRLLEPLGVTAEWFHDPRGHAQVHAGVKINAIDLAKVGVMLRDDGKWQGKQVLPAGWVDTATGQPAMASAPGVGLGWFLLDDRGLVHTGDSGAFLLVLRDKGIVAAGVHAIPGEIGMELRHVRDLTVESGASH